MQLPSIISFLFFFSIILSFGLYQNLGNFQKFFIFKNMKNSFFFFIKLLLSL